MADSNELSGFTIIMVVAVGIMAFILLFLFAKRQIMRFTLKNRRGPHCPIGLDAHRNLKKEIDRRLEAVKHIKFEPKLINPSPNQVNVSNEDSSKYDHFWRMKALDSLTILEECIIQTCNDTSKRRPPGQDLRYYLIKMSKDGPLLNCESRLIHQFVDAYIHARHEPVPPFTKEDFDNYMVLLNQLKNYIIDEHKKSLGDSSKIHSAKDTQVAINGKTRIRLIKQDQDGNEIESETSV
ncbi:uncharacterized protein C1orf43 homolog [Tetranychus urticae]|nr:uncharacterized protein C1orf43 homolog [Tetranychus urticae]